MLDRRKPYGEVMGDGVGGARWYQDGHYFSPSGAYLFSNSGAKPPAGQAHRTMEQAEAAHKAAQAAQERGERPAPAVKPAARAVAKAVQTQPPPPPGPLVQPPTLPEGATREQKLAQLNHFQLASLVKAAKGTPITGSGSKAKNVAWLLANTSE